MLVHASGRSASCYSDGMQSSRRWSGRHCPFAVLLFVGVACNDDAAPEDASVAADAALAGDAGAPEPTPHRFRKLVLSTEFLCEGAAYGDFDRDGVLDVVAGPYYYPGPEFEEAREIYPPPAQPFDVRGYSDNFFAFVRDLSGDGWDDVLFVGFPGQAAYWHENPGADGGPWPRHVVVPRVGNESPAFTDLTGDGEPELVFIDTLPEDMGYYGWAGPGADPRKPWVFHRLSPLGPYRHFTHGMGIGDVDGDGRADLIEATGFFSQPASLDGDPVWSHHAQPFGNPGGAQIAVRDVDGDGTPDAVTTMAAHGWGLSWYRQSVQGGERRFEERVIVAAAPASEGVVMFEPHALAMADIDGDGLPDIVTGERFWAHAPEDGDFDAAARVYWFRTVRTAGGVRFEPHLVDDASGVGTQVVVGDVTGDGLPDIVTANKKGAFLFVHELD